MGGYGVSAATFRGGDINRNAGRNTAEAANQGMATANAQLGGGAQLGAANSGTNAPMAGSPITVILVILGALLVIRFLSRRTGDAADYEGIVPTVQNIALITAAAMVGNVVLKGLTLNLPANNPVRAFVQAA